MIIFKDFNKEEIEKIDDVEKLFKITVSYEQVEAMLDIFQKILNNEKIKIIVWDSPRGPLMIKPYQELYDSFKNCSDRFKLIEKAEIDER